MKLGILINKYPCPKEFKTNNGEGAGIITGFSHEEYFPAIELQETPTLDKHYNKKT